MPDFFQAFDEVVKELVTDPIKAGTLRGKEASARLDRAEAMFVEMVDQMLAAERKRLDGVCGKCGYTIGDHLIPGERCPVVVLEGKD